MTPTGIVIHCSATKDDDESTINAAVIDRWHRDIGWDSIGYHFVITRQGILEKGRDENIRGAHAHGHNDKIGICLVGTDNFNRVQITKLVETLIHLLDKYEWTPEDIYCHRDFSNKECPGFSSEMIRSFLYMLDH